MSETPELPRWRGINHLALVTDDMDTTVRFYDGVLGARLVATIGTDSFRHYFFEIGPGNSVAFFEYHGAPIEPFAVAAGIPDPRKAQFDHVSFNVADAGALDALRARLLAYGCEVTEVVDHHIFRSIYFTDPNGIALEATYWVDDATARDLDPKLFGDADPVPAVREILAGGLRSTPKTELV